MDSIPQQINRYRVLEEVGRGGMAVVYRGEDQSLHREVAIKILHSHLANDSESRARFSREAQAVARLRHPHIIEIFDFAESENGISYIVTEFVHGHTLKAFMEKNQSFFPEVAVMITIQICQAIEHAHSLHIVHRDLKPENIMVDQRGVLKIMDFGIAKVIDQQQQMTLTGSILGSPAHMAPELLEGRELDFRSDLFSIGTILYWLSTGQLPFSGKNPHHVIKQIVEGTYPAPQMVNPTVSNPVARIIQRALEHEPENRFPSVASMNTALRTTLVEMDLSEVDSELRFFFEAPNKYISGLRSKITQKLLSQAKAHIRVGKHRLALESLDRLLAFEPENSDAIGIVDRIHRQQRLKRRLSLSLTILFGVLLLTAATWSVVSNWPEWATEPASNDAGSLESKDASLVASLTNPSDASVDSIDSSPPLNEKPENSAGTGEPGSSLATLEPKNIVRPPIHPAVRHPLEIFAEPYFDHLLIDGKEVAVNDRSTEYGQKYSGEITEGKHQVTIKHQACEDNVFEINVPTKLKPGTVITERKKLKFLPAILVIDSDLPKVEVFVDASYWGQAEKTKSTPISITFKEGQPTKELNLRLVHPQIGEFRKKIQVKAGEKTVVEAFREQFAPLSRDGGTP